MNKTTTAIVAGVLCIVSIASAQTVVSGTFGFSKQDVGAAEFKIVAHQFAFGDESSVTIDEAFGGTLPDGSAVYIWDGISYSIYTYFAPTWYNDGWVDASDVTIDRGDAVWAKNAGAVDAVVLFSGNVPMSDFTTNSLISGYNMLANPYPTSITLSELDLSLNPADGDSVLLFDGTSYLVYTYFAPVWYDTEWVDASAVVISISSGFWYNTSTARDWIIAKPY